MRFAWFKSRCRRLSSRTNTNRSYRKQNMMAVALETGNCSKHISSKYCPGTAEISLEIFFLVVVFTGATIGNILVLLVVKQSRRSEWTTNYFVTNLAVSNLSSPFLCILWTITWISRGSWTLGDLTCKITFFFHFLNAGVSAGLLACISLDRFYVVVHPLSFKMTKAQTKELITFVWVFMICATAPTLYFFRTITLIGDVEICSTDLEMVEWRVFIVLYFLIPFGCPFLATLALYCRITHAILVRNRQARNLTNDFRRQANRVPKPKIKVLRMLVFQWSFFVICWIPFFVTQIIQSLSAVDFTERSYIATLFVSYSNSGLNALIYSIFNSDFRRGCKRVFCKPDASQAYRLTSLPSRKNRIAPIEDFSSGEHDFAEMRLPELKPFKHHSLNGNGDKLVHQAWVSNCAQRRIDPWDFPAKTELCWGENAQNEPKIKNI